jgi:enoyl-CoA hydratase/carnithine racemase
MSETAISLRLDGNVARITIDAPGRRNALRSCDWAAIVEAVAQAETIDTVSVIRLGGANGHFGAGADIRELAQVLKDEEAAHTYFAGMEAAMAAVEAASKPIVAVVEGNCFGACVALALACDIRIAHHDAIFAITPAKLGIIYPYGDICRVVRAVGAGQARRLLYTGLTITAPEALVIGLIDQIAAADQMEASVDDLLMTLAARSAWSIRCSKTLIRDAVAGLSAHESRYDVLLSQTLHGVDLREGLAAFSEKRAPAFRRAGTAPTG